MTTQPSTGIVGNTQAAQAAATTARQAAKKSQPGAWYIKVIIAVTLGTIALTLVNLDLSLFWELLVGFALCYAGAALGKNKDKSAYKDLLWYWPEVIQTSGVLTIVVVLLGSGVGQLAKRGVEKFDSFTSCAANPSQEKCLSRGSQINTSTQQVSYVQLPACHEGWSNEVQIRPGSGFDWSWTVKAQYRWNGSGWLDHVPFSSPNAEAFRFCAKEAQHVGKDMPITWR